MSNINQLVYYILENKILDYPTFVQSKNYTCGPTSVQSVLSYYGININQDKIIKEMDIQSKPISEVGVTPNILIEYLRKYNLTAIPKQNLAVEDIIKNIDNKIPTIICIQSKPDYNKYDNGHYVVAIGYDLDNKLIIFHDSNISKRNSLSFSELDSRWHDQDYLGNKYEHFGILVKKIRR